MHAFLTGATGHIGSALVPELVRAGHTVTALARSDAATIAAQRLGATARRGDLEDLDGLRQAVNEADGVIHLAFRQEAMRNGDFAGAVASDLAAVNALGDALDGTGKTFVAASVMLPLAGLGRAATEEDIAAPGPRVDAENVVVGLALRGVRASVVRLSPITHSAELDRRGFARVLIATARRTGVSAYVGDGGNRWPAAHTRDTARLFRLAFERAEPGTRLHAVDEEGITTNEIASVVGELLGLPVESIDAGEADHHFGFLGRLFQADVPATSARTRHWLGWRPVEAGLLADLGHYAK